MPRLERDGLVAAMIDGEHIELHDQMENSYILLSVADARWLLTAALPILLASLEGQEQPSRAIRQGYRDVREA